MIDQSINESDLRDVTNLLYEHWPQDRALPVARADQPLPANPTLPDLIEAASGPTPLLAHPGEGECVAFLYSRDPAGFEDQWKTLHLMPHVVIADETHQTSVFVLDRLYTLAEVAAAASALNCDLGRPIALAGPEARYAYIGVPEGGGAFDPYTPAQLAEAFSKGSEPKPAPLPSAGPAVGSLLGNFGELNDAVARTPIDLSDPAYQQMMVISNGAGQESKSWKRSELTIEQFLILLSKHHEDKRKDGLGFVGASLIGPERKKTAVEACYVIGLDIDVGVPLAQIDAAIAKLGCLAERYTTHSHGKTSSTFVKDTIKKKMKAEAVTLEVIKAYLAEHKRWVPEILDTVEYIDDAHNPTGIEVVLRHAPIAKCRVVVPLLEPFYPGKVRESHQEGMALWNKVPAALAKLLGLELAFDRAALDPSRLFFYPRHLPDAAYDIALFGGPLFDWQTLDLDGTSGDAFEAALEAEVSGKGSKTSKSSTDEGKKLGRWSIKRAGGFQIFDVINDHAEDRIRGKNGVKMDVECPFDEDHSDPGNPEDRGFFVCNAGDGPIGVFTAKCAHDSCQHRTNLDFLGKMIKDGWFGDDVLNDPAYNPEVSEGAPRPIEAGAGVVAVGGVLDPLKDFDPERRVFDGKDAADEAIAEMNKVVSVLTQGNRTRIAIVTKNGLVFNGKDDASLRFRSYKVHYEAENAKGKLVPKVMGALDALLASDQVRIFDGIDCDPTDSLPKHMLNTWEGISIAPEAGDCSRLLAHIKNCICAGDEGHAKVLLQFFAHMFQRPAEKPGFAPVVIGPKGCGKSTLGDFLRKAIGRKHSVKIAHAKHLTGNFNKHLAGKLFVQAEEVTFGGDKKGEGVLKDAITAPSMMTEAKGLDAYEETSFSRFFLLTNPGHAVPATDGERRWFVLQAVDLFEGKPQGHPERVAYFNALHDEARNGGIAAFVDYLMNLDISDFLPFAAPHTAALADQVRQSLSDDDLWVYGVLQTGQFDTRDGEALGEEWLLQYGDDQGCEIDIADVQRSYDSHVRRYGGSSGGSGVCRAVLERYGQVDKKRRGIGDRRHYYILGSRAGWREKFTARFGIEFDQDSAEGASGDQAVETADDSAAS